MTRLLLTLAMLALASSALAQTTVNPTKVEFTASSDHSAISAVSGQPLVTSYDFTTIAMNPLGAAVFTVSLGKPTPDAVAGCSQPSPCISVVIPSLATITQNTQYTATVAAIGQSGSALSLASNPFGRVGPPTAPGKPTVK